MSSHPGTNKRCFSLLLLLVSCTQINTWCALWTFACLLAALVHESIQKSFDQTPKAFGCSKSTLRIPCQSQSQTLHPISFSGVINFSWRNHHHDVGEKAGKGAAKWTLVRGVSDEAVHACYPGEPAWVEGKPGLVSQGSLRLHPSKRCSMCGTLLPSSVPGWRLSWTWEPLLPIHSGSQTTEH